MSDAGRVAGCRDARRKDARRAAAALPISMATSAAVDHGRGSRLRTDIALARLARTAWFVWWGPRGNGRAVRV